MILPVAQPATRPTRIHHRKCIRPSDGPRMVAQSGDLSPPSYASLVPVGGEFRRDESRGRPASSNGLESLSHLQSIVCLLTILQTGGAPLCQRRFMTLRSSAAAPADTPPRSAPDSWD